MFAVVNPCHRTAEEILGFVVSLLPQVVDLTRRYSLLQELSPLIILNLPWKPLGTPQPPVQEELACPEIQVFPFEQLLSPQYQVEKMYP